MILFIRGLMFKYLSVAVLCLNLAVETYGVGNKTKANENKKLFEAPYLNFYEVRFHTGKYIYTGELLKEILKSYKSTDFRMGFQTYGRQKWHQLYRFPQFGFGFYTADLGNKEILGYPSAFYSYVNIPFIQKRKIRLSYEIAAGIAFAFNQFDTETNPTNDAIGSDKNVYVNFAFGAEYSLTSRLQMVGSIEFTHFSNGRTNQPNKGLNLVGPMIGLKYYFNSAQKVYNNNSESIYRNLERNSWFKPENGWDIFVGAGTTRVMHDKENKPGKRYYSASLSMGKFWHYNPKYKVGVGLDGYFDESLTDHHDNQGKEFRKKLMSGVYVGHEWVVGNFSLLTQLSTYLYKTTKRRGKIYSKVGVKYYPTKRFYLRMSLKTQNGAKADFIEWGCGTNFFTLK